MRRCGPTPASSRSRRECSTPSSPGGLLPHVTDAHQCLAELARVAGGGARLGLFHPIGRAALAARHDRLLSDDDVLAPARLPGLLAAAGWQVVSIDDGDDRYLAIATRRPS